MEPETRAQELNRIAESINDDRNKMVALYRRIQAISETIPNFNNPDIDKMANTVLQGLKMMEQWIAVTAQKHFNSKSETREELKK